MPLNVDKPPNKTNSSKRAISYINNHVRKKLILILLVHRRLCATYTDDLYSARHLRKFEAIKKILTQQYQKQFYRRDLSVSVAVQDLED